MTYKVAFSFADGKTLFCNVQNNELLLDAALRSGITLPMDCREGVCATCQGVASRGSTHRITWTMRRFRPATWRNARC